MELGHMGSTDTSSWTWARLTNMCTRKWAPITIALQLLFN
jgi:hypothetical protein